MHLTLTLTFSLRNSVAILGKVDDLRGMVKGWESHLVSGIALLLRSKGKAPWEREVEGRGGIGNRGTNGSENDSGTYTSL